MVINVFVSRPVDVQEKLLPEYGKVKICKMFHTKEEKRRSSKRRYFYDENDSENESDNSEILDKKPKCKVTKKWV